MSGGYYYLVASLPHLQFGAAPRLTPGEFLRRCAAQVSVAHYRILAEAELFQTQPAKTGLALLDRWHEHERALRNALACERAKRLGVAAATHLRDFRPDPASPKSPDNSSRSIRRSSLTKHWIARAGGCWKNWRSGTTSIWRRWSFIC